MNETFGFKRETATGQKPIFQAQFETAQGGFTLDETVITAGVIIPAGTVIAYDEATRKAKPFKGGVLQANVTNSATAYPVLKGSNIAAGMSVNLPGGTAKTVTSVDKSDPNFDTVNVATTIGVAANAGIGISVVDAGSTGTMLGLLRNDVEQPAAGVTATLSVVIRGTAYERRIPPVSAAQKALMPNIIFSQSM